MDEGTPSIRIPTEKLFITRQALKEIQPKALVRRFIVDCHNGVVYHNIEHDLYDRDGEYVSDEDILKYLRNETYKFKRCKIYSCIEVKGEHSLKELENLSPQEAKEVMRVVFYDAKLEPLSAYSKMI